jgi:hypothetical protein
MTARAKLKEVAAVAPRPISDFIDVETCRYIREALLIGLSSFGEIERLDNAYDIHVEIGCDQIPGDLRPIHPTGAPDTICRFAESLRALDSVEQAIEKQERELASCPA